MISNLLKKILILIDTIWLFGFYLRSYFAVPNSNISEKEKLFTLDNKNKKKKLLIMSYTNTPYSIKFESLIAAYFNRRDYQIYFLTNFGFRRAVKIFRGIGGLLVGQLKFYLKHSILLLGRELPSVPADELAMKAYKYEGVPLGICVFSSVCSKLYSGRIDFSNPRIKKLVTRYFYRSIIYLHSARDMIKKIKPDLVFANDKGYSGNHELCQVALELKIPFIQWVGCQQPGTLVFKRYSRSNEREHPNSLSKQTWQSVKNKPWKERIRQEVYGYFERGYLSKDWFKYKNLLVDTELITKEELAKKYDLDLNKKIAVLFAHIIWDANLFYGDDLFDHGFEEWMIESLKVMAANKNVNWLIKVHPANKFKFTTENIKGNYKEIDIMNGIFPAGVPNHIKLIMPEDNINPCALFKTINYGLTVRGTIGVELPCFGVPVLTAGTGRYSYLGFTIDSKSKEEYLAKLARIEEVKPLTEEQIRLACLHTHTLFHSRPYPITSFVDKKGTKGAERDLEVMIDDLVKGRDLANIVDWAFNSQEEDLLI